MPAELTFSGMCVVWPPYHPRAADPLGHLDGDTPLALVDEDDRRDRDDRQDDEDTARPTKSVPLTTPGPPASASRATIPPKMIIEMPLPMPYWVISSPIQISSIVPAAIVIMIESVPSGSTSKPKFGR